MLGFVPKYIGCFCFSVCVALLNSILLSGAIFTLVYFKYRSMNVSTCSNGWKREIRGSFVRIKSNAGIPMKEELPL